MIECLLDVAVHLDGPKNKCYYCCIYCNEKETCKYACPLSNQTEEIVEKECNSCC